MNIKPFDSSTWPVLDKSHPRVRQVVESYAARHGVDLDTVEVRGYLPGTFPDRPTQEGYECDYTADQRPRYRSISDPEGLTL